MNLVLDEMSNALVKALKPARGISLLTEVAEYDRNLRNSRFYDKCVEEDRKWQREQRKEEQELARSKGFKNQWH